MTDGSAGPDDGPFQHATAVLLGCNGVLLRGPSGSGKSLLAQMLLAEARTRRHFAALIGDDRVQLIAGSFGLIAAGAPAIAGLVELRGRGIQRHLHEPQALIRLVVDLVPPADLERMPAAGQLQCVLAGVSLPLQPVPAGSSMHQLALVRAALREVCGEAGCPL